MTRDFRTLRSVVVLALLFGGARNGLAEDWPCFRGPTRQGISAEKDLPTAWSATDNVAWKQPIPGSGWSSPIVHGNRVFLTATAGDGAPCHVIALDRRTGRILWDREVFRQTLRKKQQRNSYATPTPATDGERVYALFADGGIAALDMAGKLVWTWRDYKHYSEHGLGTSPVLWEDLLIVSFDGSSDGDNKKLGWQIPWDGAFILALDRRTGKVRWKSSRGLSRIAHVTPNILPGPKPQLATAAGDVIQGFDLATGARLWSVHAQGEGVVPSVVVGDGLVFAASGFEKSTIRAVRTNGSGDVTATHVAWEQTRAVPRIPSFLYVGPYLFTINEGGIAMCLRAESGEVVWHERIGGPHSASPVYAGGLLYFLSDSGETTIIKAAPGFEVVARNSIGEFCQASPAISQGQIFIRSEGNLFCIGTSRR